MKAEIVSRERRRFVIVTGLAAVAASLPLPLSAAQPGPAFAGGKLIISGRLTGADGHAVAGATLDVWHAGGPVSATTDADGRFMFETAVHYRDMKKGMRYRLNGATASRALDLTRKGYLYRDEAGGLRATFGITVA